MKILRVTIDRAAGLPHGLDARPFGDRITVVVGPNASGKTTIARVVQGVIWPDLARRDDLVARVEWLIDGVTWTAEREGRRVTWWRADAPSTEPSGLPPRDLAASTLVESQDLAPPRPGEDDARLARRIAMALAGGFDVTSVVRDLGGRFGGQVGVRSGARRALRDARRAVRDLQRDQSKLAAEEARLGEERARLDALRGQAGREEVYRRANDLRMHRARLAALIAQLETMPEAAGRVRGDETEALARLDDVLRDTQGRIDSARAELDETTRRIDEHPSRELLDDDVRAALTDRAKELRDLADAVDEARDRAAAARSSLARARAPLGDASAGREEHSADAGIPADALDRIEAWLRRGAEHEGRRAKLAEERHLLENDPAARGPTDDLRDAAGVLREAARAGAPRGAWGTVLASSLIAFAASVAVLFVDDRWVFGALAAAATASLVAGVSWWASAARRRRARARLHELGVDEPESWRPVAIDAHVARLIVEAERSEELARRLAALAAREKSLVDERSELLTEARAIADASGIDVVASGVRSAELARRLALLAEARAELGDAEDRVTTLEVRYAREERGLIDALAARESAGGAAVPDGEGSAAQRARALGRCVDRLVRDDDVLRRLLSRQDDARRALESAERERARASEERSRLFERAGIEDGDRDALNEAVRAQPRFAELSEERLGLRGAIASDENSLGDDASLAQLDEAELERRRAEAVSARNDADELAEAITRIETRIDRARGQRALEEALAKVDAECASFEAEREAALAACAQSWLLRRAHDEHVARDQPAVLREAKRLFAVFTRDRFQLGIEPGAVEGPRFYAIDASNGRRVSVAELSTGTRTQLLLAARLAFLEATEDGQRLPIFLDEVLGFSDPERFRAVVESLEAVADEGRQVVYLTCQPSDVAAWRSILGASATGLEVLELGRVETTFETDASLLFRHVPSAGGTDPEEYARLVGVPAFDPHAGTGSIHLFHLLRDRLDLLETLLSAGIETAGQWKSVAERGAAAHYADDREARRLDARVAVAEDVARAWLIGRPPPTPRALLAEAGVSETFEEEVAALLAELGGDAAALIIALEEGRVKGYRKAKIDDLRDALRARGHLDEREPLGIDAIVGRAIAAGARHVASGALDADEPARVARGLLAGTARVTRDDAAARGSSRG